MSTAARGASAPASAPAARAAPRRASATSPRRSAVPARPRVASPAARLGRRAGAVTAISSADAEIPEPEARDDAATDAAAAESNLNDLQAQLAALMSSNQALQQDLEKARPPEPEPEPAASTSAPAVPFGAPRHRRAGDRAPRARARRTSQPRHGRHRSMAAPRREPAVLGTRTVPRAAPFGG